MRVAVLADTGVWVATLDQKSTVAAAEALAASAGLVARALDPRIGMSMKIQFSGTQQLVRR